MVLQVPLLVYFKSFNLLFVSCISYNIINVLDIKFFIHFLQHNAYKSTQPAQKIPATDQESESQNAADKIKAIVRGGPDLSDFISGEIPEGAKWAEYKGEHNFSLIATIK